MAGGKKKASGLMSQYADLRDDDDDDDLDADEGTELPSPEGLESSTLSTEPSQALPVGDDGVQSDCERMSEGSIVDGSWFPPNRKSGSKRLRDPESGSLVSLLEPSKKAKNPLYPSNKTVVSQGSRMTIVIAQEPDDVGEFQGSSSKRFSLDPLGVARGLKVILDYSSVKDVRINRRRNVVAVEFSSVEASEKTALLAATHVGKYAVHCYRPATDFFNVSWGVIHHVSLEEDLEELQAIITCDAFPVVKIVRLNKFTGGSKQPSTSVKLGFDGNSLPKFVQIDFVQVPVKPFVEPPLRCYRCQRAGHLASGCTAAIRCLVCAGNHTKDSCTADKPSCANCGGDHIASSRSCRVVLEGLKIQGLVKDGLTFAEARKRVRAESSAGSTALAANSSFVRTPSAMSQVIQAGAVRGTPRGFPASESSSSQPTGLETVTVSAEVHQSQGSYIIPHRYPRQRPSYARSLFPGFPHQPATQDLVQDESATLSSVPSHAPLAASPAVLPPASAVHPDSCASSLEDSIAEKCLRHLDQSMESLFSRLSKFLIEVFSTNLALENKRQRELLLIGMVRNHFGPTVGDTLLSDFHAAGDAQVAVTEKPLTRSTSLTRKAKGSGIPVLSSVSAKNGRGAPKKATPSSAKPVSSKK